MRIALPVVLSIAFLVQSCEQEETSQGYRLWYDEPAEEWTEALPIGNGRIGAMVYGGVQKDHIQFNEETLWTGEPREYSREGAAEYLDELRALLFAGKQDEAEALAGKHFMGRMSNEEAYPSQLYAWLKKVRGKENLKYAVVEYDDADWKTMDMSNPQGWEELGFQGLDGAVWLRFAFELPEDWAGKELVLNLGRIRDTDYTYLNGGFVASDDNKFGRRRYPVSSKLVRKGKNVIAIQVLNFYDDGGMIGFKDDEPMVVYPKGGDISEGIPLDVDWKYFIQDRNPPAYPRYEAAYQPFGDLWLEFEGHENAENYTRELTLDNAITTTSYEVDGVIYTREYFISAPDQALVVNLKSSKPNMLNLSASFASLHQEHEVASVNENTLKLKAQVKNGALYGISYLKGKNKGGELSVAEGSISVQNATEVTFYMTAATNYVSFDDVSADAGKLAMEDLASLSDKSFQKIKTAHVADYQELYQAFDIRLGNNDLDLLTTDKRIVEFNKTQDPSLVALYAQYGRYLLISSSRAGTRPANLQGIWNDQLTPPWDSKYTCNINAEMNYWPADLLNLSSTHTALFDMIEEVAEQGKKTAQNHYAADGWVLHHNTDLWRATAPINNPNHGIWVTGGAWMCHHLWDHFEFTLDTAFLRERAYPIIKGSAEFFVDFLIEDPNTGLLISGPSNSPENGGLVMGPAMDHQIIRDLFQNCIDAAEVLGISDDFTETLKEKLPKITPDQIGQYGQLQEWKDDIDNPDNHHRHVSHLWAVYPGDQIGVNTPELMEAAIKSLEFRGDEGTGWSLAWKINLWARFRDGNHAWKMIQSLLSPAWMERSGRGGSYVNLFDAHPPFQIDGNFGAAAGIVEMIVQSHKDKIVLLPALPDALPEGKLRGVRLRGGVVADLSWKNGELLSVSLLIPADKTYLIEYGDGSITVQGRSGETISLGANLNPL